MFLSLLRQSYTVAHGLQNRIVQFFRFLCDGDKQYSQINKNSLAYTWTLINQLPQKNLLNVIVIKFFIHIHDVVLLAR